MNKVRYSAIAFVCILVIFIGGCCQKSFDTKDIYQFAIQRTVEIRSYNEFDNIGYATGCIISDDGKILTNKHVVNLKGSNFKNVEIRFYNSEEFIPATIVSVSTTDDLAVIKIEQQTEHFFQIGKSVVGGENVYTIGNPNGFGLSFSEGKVSSPLRKMQNNGNIVDTIQTSIVINEGNSGGALINDQCELIGLMSFRLRNNGGEVIQGVSFAVHYSVINSFILSCG